MPRNTVCISSASAFAVDASLFGVRKALRAAPNPLVSRSSWLSDLGNTQQASVEL